MLLALNFGLPVEFMGYRVIRAIEVHKDLKEGGCNTLLNRNVVRTLLFCRTVEFLSSHKWAKREKRFFAYCGVICKQRPPIPIASYNRTVNYIDLN
jgi:hypothetical protein